MKQEDRPAREGILALTGWDQVKFCTIECLRDWAYVHAETDGAAAGSEAP